MAGPISLQAGHSPAAHEHRAAGRAYLWIRDRVRDLATVLVVSVIAFGVFLLGMGVLALIVGVAHAQEPGQGSDAKIGGVTVTAPDCRQPQNPAPACAAQRLNQAAQSAEAKGQAGATTATITVPDAQTPAATIGLGTPAAAAQQPGTAYGKAPGYIPPPPVADRNGAGAGAIVRSPR